MSKELARQAERMPSMSITPRRLPFVRVALGPMMRAAGRKLEPGVNFTDQTLGGVDVRVYRPTSQPRPADSSPGLIWIHGGGLILGSHKENSVCSALVAALGIPVVSVKYRLAPEHPFPAALDDLFAVVSSIHAGKLPGVDPDRLAVGGQSAGGGLAASLAQRLLDEDMNAAGQLLIYPMLDDRTAVQTDIGDREHKAWNKCSNLTGWTSYLGTTPGQETPPPYAVPARRDNLSGLPPAWVGVGSADMFHHESVEYAERLQAAGVPCETTIVQDAIHGFDGLPGGKDSPEAEQFRMSQHRFLRGVLGLPPI